MAQDKEQQDVLDAMGGNDDWIDEEQHWNEVRSDMGANLTTIAKQSKFKRAVFEFIYDPKTELSIFFLIVLSITLLVVEVSMPAKGPVGWLGSISAREAKGWFVYLDVVFSLIFLAEYLIKLWIAPRKFYFIRNNIIDLLAILPILRVFRLGRAVRLLRLLRLLRLMRVGVILQQRLNGLSEELQRRTAENMIIFIYLLFSLVFGTVGVMVFEKGNNPGFQTLGDGLWWCVVTLTTVGYGDISPKTTGGKFVAVIIMFIGLSFYALLTGLLSTIIIERAKQREAQGMEIANLINHVVICGWNETGKRLVSDLIKSNKDPDVVVLYNNSTYPKLLDPNVHYIEADPTTAEGLELARIPNASVAVILPDQSESRTSQDADARSILTILAVERINPNIHSIVELLNDENVYHVRNAGCDEVIVSGSYTGTMISQVVQFPGISDVFGSLFDPGEGSQVYEKQLPDEMVGKSFSDVSSSLFENGRGVLIGYRRGTDLVMSPKKDVELKAKDNIIIIRQV